MSILHTLYSLLGVGREECEHRYALDENCPYCEGILKRQSIALYIEDQAQRRAKRIRQCNEEDRLEKAIQDRTNELLKDC